MVSLAVLQADVARSSSDYIAVSRQSGLFDPDAYERAEEAAWARLMTAVEALTALCQDDVDGDETEREKTCAASR